MNPIDAAEWPFFRERFKESASPGGVAWSARGLQADEAGRGVFANLAENACNPGSLAVEWPEKA
jgi:hypothetical protein